MKILVVDDHPLARKGIISILSLEGSYDEIFEACNGAEAVEIIEREQPDLSMIDLYLAGEDGLDIVAKARDKGAKTKFIILTSSLKKEDFHRAREVGVEGYVLKEAFAEDILYALAIVLRGKQFIDPEIVKYQINSSQEDRRFNELTLRERDVLAEIGRGLSNHEIAGKLFISENTVKKHVSNILFKLDLAHRTQVALLANKKLNF